MLSIGGMAAPMSCAWTVAYMPSSGLFRSPDSSCEGAQLALLQGSGVRAAGEEARGQAHPLSAYKPTSGNSGARPQFALD